VREPGWGGQKFIDGSLERIKAARALRDRINPKLDIEIDAGSMRRPAAVRRERGTVLVAAASSSVTRRA